MAILYLLIGVICAQGLFFGFLFLVFYLVLCWVLILYNLMVRKAGSQVLGSLALTVVIFVSFPRVELGLFSIGANSHPLSGFSKKVTLGEV